MMHPRSNVVVLIPAYEPDEKLVRLVADLEPLFSHVVVVDDGSTKSGGVFKAIAGSVDAILVHETNKGKGAALKSGFAYIAMHYEGVGVVTADADGQHRPEDILKVADALEEHSDGLVLGVRAFNGYVPFRSRFGNGCTKIIFFLTTGMRISDTQTGLRGIPFALLKDIAAIPGDRYEYEMAMLVAARHHKKRPLEIPIETVYLEGNQSSHFNPILDAIRIYRTLLHFSVASILAFLIDNICFAILVALLSATGDMSREKYVCLALCIARFLSGNFQYFYNSGFVFKARSKVVSYFQYWALALAIATLSYFGTTGLSALVDAHSQLITCIKIVVEMVLFFCSYKVQKMWIFKS